MSKIDFFPIVIRFCPWVKENTPAVVGQQGYSSCQDIACHLLHKPPVRGISLDGFAYTRNKLGGI